MSPAGGPSPLVAPRRRWVGVPPFAVVAALFFGVLILGIAIGQTDKLARPHKLALAGFLSAALGALSGASEILGRYRDEPLLAVCTKPGAAYCCLNAFVSLLAFMVVVRYPDVFKGVSDDLFMTLVLAGFGGMAVMRSKLFTVRSETGQEYSFGPAIVLETILRTVDRNIDRRRAADRLQRIYEKMTREVDLTPEDFGRAVQFFEFSLLSFQNLSQPEKAEIKATFDEYKNNAEWPPNLKLAALGLAFLNVAGEDNFDQLIAEFKRYLQDLKRMQAGAPGGPS